MNDILKQIIADVCYVGITAIVGVITYQFKKFVAAHQSFIDKQKETLQKELGIKQYNADVEKAKLLIHAVEQMGREFNWEGTIKHSKATEMIAQATGLSSGDIYSIIKATVDDYNKDKQTTQQTPQQ